MAGTPKRPFHTASDADVKSGEVFDVYFVRIREFVLEQLGRLSLDTLRRKRQRQDF